MPRICLLALLWFVAVNTTWAQPRPTKAQLDWHQQEYYWFMHFGPNTFTGAEWGSGQERAADFQPNQLDARQWCRLAKSAGAKGIIITAKHHDGFCLWPSKYSTHTVRESGWRNGQGDVLKDLSEACREYGLKFGVYLSPWDRNHPDYGTPRYNEVFVNMMKEVLTGYGPVWELWWDGANGEGPNGKKQVYDWELFRKTVRDLSPQTVVFSDVGPDIRWVGNEKGIAGETNWNTLNIEGFTAGEGAPPTDTLNTGNKYGRHWIPGECDVSIRPGWFWRRSEDSLVKTPEQLFDLYLKSVGRGANLLLNVPPNDKGLISESDSVAVMGFADLRAKCFRQNLAQKAAYFVSKKRDLGSIHRIDSTADVLSVQLTRKEVLNLIVLKEDLQNGQSCARFEIELIGEKGKVLHKIQGTTIGNKRMLLFPETEITEIRLRILEAKGSVGISKLDAYRLRVGG